MKIEPYLFFDGNAEEALAFYAEALGGTVESTMRYADCPEPMPAEYLPPGGPRKLLNASLLVQGQRIMLCDGVRQESGEFRGVALTLQYGSESDARRAFDALAREGQVIMPIGPTFFSPCFGQVTDRYGVRWMVMIESPQPA
jgi:PhnB protein